MESLQAYRIILDSIPEPVLVKDADLNCVLCNKAFCELTGLRPADVIGRPGADHAEPEQVEVFLRTEREVLESGEQTEVEEVYTHPDGGRIVLKARKCRIFLPGPEGETPYIVISLVDVTHLRELEEELASVLDSTTDSVMVLDRDWRVTYLNQNAKLTLSGYGVEEGMRLWDAVPGLEDGAFGQHYRQAMESGEPVSFEEYFAETGHWVEGHAFPTPKGLSVFYHDVTERRQAEQERLNAQERLIHMARHDMLTGLPNRQQFSDRVERALAEASGDLCAAILFIDLDGFKAVNDTLGHEAGDLLLQRVTERIQNTIRGSDMVARFGGDEFAVLQTGVRNRDMAGELAARLVSVLSEPFEIRGQVTMIGASVGVALAPAHGATPEALLRAADTALYAAKEGGRGGYRFFEADLDALTRERQAMRAALRLAVAREEFELRFQPLIDLKSGKLVCLEALLRWRNPDRGLVSPADFIPLAEETGLIIPIGEWVLRQACERAAEWPGDVSLAVNLSPVQFRQAGLVEAVSQALEQSGLEPHRLQLEITESVLLEEENANLEILKALRRLGAQISLDDFGTGYSSLGYLRSFPFDKVKLDKSFVRDVESRREARAIVHAMADLGAGLGLTMAAEGIETHAQLEAVRREGYREGQGYLFSRPVEAEHVPALILEGAGRAMQAAAQGGREPGAGPAEDEAGPPPDGRLDGRSAG